MKIIKDFNSLASNIEITKFKNIMDNYIMDNYITSFDANLTWGENSLDDLDLVEFIMILEKEFKLHIPDHISEQISANKPIVLINSIIYSSREYKIDLILSREEIAGMVGTATESVIRLLSEFKKDELIDLDGKKI